MMSAKLDLNSPWIGDNPWFLTHGMQEVGLIDFRQNEKGIWEYFVVENPEFHGLGYDGGKVQVELDSRLIGPISIRNMGKRIVEKRTVPSRDRIQIAKQDIAKRAVMELANHPIGNGINYGVLLKDYRLIELLTIGRGEIPKNVDRGFYLVRYGVKGLPNSKAL